MNSKAEAQSSSPTSSNGTPRPLMRPNAFHEASQIYESFFRQPLPSAADAQAATDTHPPKNERMCIGGHRETIFGISFSPDGKYLATASQDSTVCIWEVSSHRLVVTLTEGMDAKYECLRVTWMKARDDRSN